MKNLFFLLSVSFILSSCGIFKTVDVNRLQLGMSKAQVSSMFGDADRVLYAGRSNKGYEEVLQYRTSRNELYALTFFNDQLESYEFLTEEIPVGSQVRPPVTHPVYPPPPAQRPGDNRPNYPPTNNNNQRSPSNTGRTDTTNRPASSGRSSSTSSGRESSSGNQSEQSGNQGRSTRSTTDSQETKE